MSYLKEADPMLQMTGGWWSLEVLCDLMVGHMGTHEQQEKPEQQQQQQLSHQQK